MPLSVCCPWCVLVVVMGLAGRGARGAQGPLGGALPTAAGGGSTNQSTRATATRLPVIILSVPLILPSSVSPPSEPAAMAGEVRDDGRGGLCMVDEEEEDDVCPGEIYSWTQLTTTTSS